MRYDSYRFLSLKTNPQIKLLYHVISYLRKLKLKLLKMALLNIFELK